MTRLLPGLEWQYGLGLIGAIGMLFSPLLHLEWEGSGLSIYGMTVLGDKEQIAGLAAARSIQFTLLLLLPANWMAAFFQAGRIRYLATVFNVFLLILLPVWFMLIVENLNRPQLSSPVELYFSYGWRLAAIWHSWCAVPKLLP